MLSILIPVYNQRVTELVEKLVKLCDKAGITYQISVFDDGSKAKYKEHNETLLHTFNVNYVELSENLGRAKIRNWLAKSAAYPYLLFLDCDTKIIGKDFIAKYLEEIKKGSQVVFGGRVYQKKQPTAKTKVLHWKYGSRVEFQPVAKRYQQPYLHFHSNNFLIAAEIFKKHQFDTDLTSYGYEDLLFAENLQKDAVPVVHIDNPTLHLGLETATQLLKKTKVAVQNLHVLNQKDHLQNVRLTKMYRKIKNFLLGPSFLSFLAKKEPYFESKLHDKSPKLLFFSLWKLIQYHKLEQD